MPATLAILSIVFVESIFSAAGVTDQAASISHKLLSVLIMVMMNLGEYYIVSPCPVPSYGRPLDPSPYRLDAPLTTASELH